jgi:hypothetical protein
MRGADVMTGLNDVLSPLFFYFIIIIILWATRGWLTTSSRTSCNTQTSAKHRTLSHKTLLYLPFIFTVFDCLFFNKRKNNKSWAAKRIKERERERKTKSIGIEPLEKSNGGCRALSDGNSNLVDLYSVEKGSCLTSRGDLQEKDLVPPLLLLLDNHRCHEAKGIYDSARDCFFL